MMMVGSAELESATSCVSSTRSNQLSYEPMAGFFVAPKVATWPSKGHSSIWFRHGYHPTCAYVSR